MSLATLKRKTNTKDCLFCHQHTSIFHSPPYNGLNGVNIVRNSLCNNCSSISFDSNVFVTGPKTNTHGKKLTYPQNCCLPTVKSPPSKNSEEKTTELVLATICGKDKEYTAKGNCNNGNNCSGKESSYFKDLSTPNYKLYMDNLINKRSCFK
jgi:hypothetical protein